MATTITAATLTVTITEEITLNGQDKGATNTLTIASITEASQRIVEIPTSEITVLSFQATTPGAGTFNEADVRYIRLTNKDDTNFIQIIVASENNAESAHKLEAGHSIFIAVSAEGVVNVHDASASALTVSFDDITSVTALANTAACDLEYFVAGV
jgi:predicted transcriptional regulator